MTDTTLYPPKSPFWQCLEGWGISRQEYINTPVAKLFLTVEELVCKSISESPDSKIAIFNRGDKWGFALSVWATIGLGESWPPAVQATVFNSQAEARAAGIDMFIRMAESDMIAKQAPG